MLFHNFLSTFESIPCERVLTVYITVFVLIARLADFKKFDLFYSIALFQTQVAKFAEDYV